MPKPVILIGQGCRDADVKKLSYLNVPILTSWQAIDLLDSDNNFNFGRPGIYGQRCANRILSEADEIISIGCRLSIWTVGYDFTHQNLTQVDIDEREAKSWAKFVRMDAKDYIEQMRPFKRNMEWNEACFAWRKQFPWIEKAHNDKDGYINSYRFMNEINGLLKPDAVIVTDVGGYACSAQQVLRLTPPQRILSSGGLGEMGCGIPGAIGASFSLGMKEVICFVGDGSAMINLQELQTIAHHQLPIKIFVFNNGGYLMIRKTQDLILDGRHYGVDSSSGLSVPDFRRVAAAFGIASTEIRNWDDYHRVMPYVLGETAPVLCEVFMHPDQPIVPKLNPIKREDGTLGTPNFAQLSPIL
jgi:acetolactate synthase-1/2/3 large subunit